MDSLRTSKVCKFLDPNMDKEMVLYSYLLREMDINFLFFYFHFSLVDENEYTFKTEENNNDSIQACGQINSSGFSNDYQDVFSDDDNMLDNPTENNHMHTYYYIDKFNKLNEHNNKFEEIQGTSEKPFKLLHMQSSRSSLKSSMTKEKI